MHKTYDFIVIGAGIIGLTMARTLYKRGHQNILVLEKEAALGCHSSGRNSGVLHAGLYYASDSLKAKLCASGSKAMQEYAKENGIKVIKNGKVVVAQSESHIESLAQLYDRAIKNKIPIKKIDLKELAEIEPEARSFEFALHSPETAVIDSKQVLESLRIELTRYGVKIQTSHEALKIDAELKTVVTQHKNNSETHRYGHLINAAGLHADKIAHWMGVGENFVIVPFKGIYQKLDKNAQDRFRGSIYPAPDLKLPFLGVHITKTVDGTVIVGPSAHPAFGRENYSGLEGLDVSETPMILSRIAAMWFKNVSGFRLLTKDAINKGGARGFLKMAKELAPNLSSSDIQTSGKIGIRAQLIEKKSKKLVMDFVCEDGPNSTHVLNAVSPAFTSSLAFSEWLVDRMKA